MVVGEELKSWIGRTAIYHAPEEVGHSSIRYFAFALKDDNPIYQDESFASESRHGGIIAPPTLVCETSQFVRREPDITGYAGHSWPLPITSARFIRGGNEYEFFQPVRPSDKVTVIWTILDIYERATRAFGKAIFVVSEARYINDREELLALNRETNVYAS